MSRHIELTHNNKTKTLKEWARFYSITPAALYARLYVYNWSIEEALRHKKEKAKIFLTYNGKTQSITKWSEELDLPRRTIQERLGKGWSIDLVLDTAYRIPFYSRLDPISLEDGIDAWKGIMISRYGKNFASRFRMALYRHVGQVYRELQAHALTKAA